LIIYAAQFQKSVTACTFGFIGIKQFVFAVEESILLYQSEDAALTAKKG
jgi:hypothetical protein